MLPNGQTPLASAPTMTSSIINSIALPAIRRDDQNEALKFGVPNQVGRVLRLCGVNDALCNTLNRHFIIRPLSAPCRHRGGKPWVKVSGRGGIESMIS